MQTEGYTVFTGPLKHGNKQKNNVQKGDLETEVYKKSEHSNKNHIDGKKIAKIMNDE